MSQVPSELSRGQVPSAKVPSSASQPPLSAVSPSTVASPEYSVHLPILVLVQLYDLPEAAAPPPSPAFSALSPPPAFSSFLPHAVARPRHREIERTRRMEPP